MAIQTINFDSAAGNFQKGLGDSVGKAVSSALTNKILQPYLENVDANNPNSILQAINSAPQALQPKLRSLFEGQLRTADIATKQQQQQEIFKREGIESESVLDERNRKLNLLEKKDARSASLEERELKRIEKQDKRIEEKHLNTLSMQEQQIKENEAKLEKLNLISKRASETEELKLNIERAKLDNLIREGNASTTAIRQNTEIAFETYARNRVRDEDLMDVYLRAGKKYQNLPLDERYDKTNAEVQSYINVIDGISRSIQKRGYFSRKWKGLPDNDLSSYSKTIQNTIQKFGITPEVIRNHLSSSGIIGNDLEAIMTPDIGNVIKKLKRLEPFLETIDNPFSSMGSSPNPKMVTSVLSSLLSEGTSVNYLFTYLRDSHISNAQATKIMQNAADDVQLTKEQQKDLVNLQNQKIAALQRAFRE